MSAVFADEAVQAKLQAEGIKMSHTRADVDGPRLHNKYGVTTIPYMILLDYDAETNRAKLLRKTRQGEVLSREATLRFLTPP